MTVSHIKLPELKLVDFDGNVANWAKFYNTFRSLVGKRTHIDGVTKFAYLNQCLKGKAKEVISGFAGGEDDYNLAIQALEDYFADPRKLERTLIRSLLDLKSPHYKKDELQDFQVKFETILRQLGVRRNLENSEWLLQEILQFKLPLEAEKFIFNKVKCKYFSVQDIKEGLADLIDFLSDNVVAEKRFLGKQNDTKPIRNTPFKGNVETANNKDKHKDLGIYNCIFCDLPGHKNYECDKYPNVQVRKQRLREKNRCDKCCLNHSGDCINLKPCFVCSGSHHTYLCCVHGGNKSQKTKADKPVKKTPENTNAQVNSLLTKYNAHKYSVALPTATAKVQNDKHRNSTETVRVLFDQGSQKSLITKCLADKLKLDTVATIGYNLGSLHGQSRQKYDVVKPLIRIGARALVIFALVVDNLPQPIHTPGLMNTVVKLKREKYRLADKHLTSDTVDNIQLFIGGDFYSSFVQQIVEYDGTKLLKVNNSFMIFGPILNSVMKECSPPCSNNQLLVLRLSSNLIPGEINAYTEEGIEQPHKLWELDSIGINPHEPSPDEQCAYNEFLNTITYTDNQYWVRLPWKLNKPYLANNYSVALGQLYSQINHLSKHPELLDCYDKLIHEQLDKGFIEEVPNACVTESVHYLPHHCVRKISKTTPVRIVYNCSSKSKSSASLNECLNTGPSLTSILGNVLVKFRTKQFGYTADISKAFLKIGLQECDRDFTRFLWLANPHDTNSKLKTYRFKSVLFGATSSPFLLQATLKYHFYNSKSPLKDLLKEGFYVDNLIGSADSESELFEVYHIANEELNKANMPLGQWNTNNKALQNKIAIDYPVYDREEEISVLGVIWNVKSDTLHLKFVEFDKKQVITKRSLLSLVSMVFDPLGLCSPVLVKGKLLIQSAWQLNVKWDDELPTNFHDQWADLQTEFEKLPHINFPRSTANSQQEYSLNIFCDASTKAYGAVAYMTDMAESHLLMSKVKVAPLQSRTLPQLEITAVQVGCYLAKYLKEQLSQIKMTEINLWTDSEVVLQWINNDKSKITYVKNRVANIKLVSNNMRFFYVGTKENPADLLSRGIKVDKFANNPLWFYGPAWLHDKKLWPPQKWEVAVVSEIVAENLPVVEPVKCVFPVEKFSSFDKLIRITRYIFKFLKIMIPTLVLPHPEIYWIKVLQRQNFPIIYELLQGKDLSGVGTSRRMIKDLGLYLDPFDSLIKSRGRIQHSDLAIQGKHPILLASKSYLASLIIQRAHRLTFHGGVQETLLQVRKQFWIPKGRQAVKTIISSCVHCKKILGKPYKYPGPPPLPKERVTLGYPFENVGIDYTGALTITDTKSKCPEKYYICLFTCMATRAVHLELASDLSAQTFINLFRRFCARRSTPSLVISDNGTNFIASAKFFEDQLTNSSVMSYMTEQKITWKFINPRSPWQGGFYERLIGLVKTCLKKVLYRKKINYDELQTFLTEVEARVNNRPLTYIVDERDSVEPLTPSHFLHGRTLQVLPPLVTENPNDPPYMDHSALNKMYSFMSSALNQFAKLWHKEYLVSLREKHYGNEKANQTENINKGDVVLIDNNSPRETWPLGRIEELHYDSEGIIRSVDVFHNGTTSLRTLNKLIPLEVSELISSSSNVKDSINNASSLGSESSRPLDSTRAVDGDSSRPKREAAVKANKIIKRWLANE